MFGSISTIAVLLASLHLSDALPQPRSPISERDSTNPLSRRTSQAEYVNNAIAAFNQMQTWYDKSTGLWQGSWWPSANALTTIADFQAYFPGELLSITDLVYPNTLANAPKSFGSGGFLDGFYDDELWWALGWIQVYDVTGDPKYLNTATAIFEDAKAAWGTTPCNGGIWWDKAHTYVNAIANELYITTAAKLANRSPHSPSDGYYWNEALKAHDWFMASGMINSDNVVNDGLNSNCQNNGYETFTYNSGVILGGLTEMAWASGDNSYNEKANTLALAAIAHFTDSNGILHEPCEPNSCDSDEQQFKGILARNINFMVNRATNLPESTRETYVNFLQKNADSIWAHDQSNDFLGLVFNGPPGTATIQTQGSALDVIVGAAAAF